jgi:hypothetical protein
MQSEVITQPRAGEKFLGTQVVPTRPNTKNTKTNSSRNAKQLNI